MIKRFYKQVVVQGIERDYLDFDKIRMEAPPIKIIITERGRQGKSFNAKEHLLDRYLKSRKTENAIWIFNQQQQIDDNYDKFLINNQKAYPKRWAKFSVGRQGVFDRDEKVYFIKFVSLWTYAKYKHGRDSAVKTLIYDEFNEGLELVSNNQMSYLESLLHTFTDPSSPQSHAEVNLFIFGNQKTMNIPLFVDLGIQKLSKELELFHRMQHSGDGKQYLVMVYTPTMEPERMKEVKKSWLYEFSEKANLQKASYGNINIFDSNEGVVDADDLIDYWNEYESMGFALVGGRWFEIGQHRHDADKFFVVWVSDETIIKPQDEKCAFLPQDAGWGVFNQSIFLKKVLSIAMWTGNIKFACFISKMAFLNVAW